MIASKENAVDYYIRDSSVSSTVEKSSSELFGEIGIIRKIVLEQLFMLKIPLQPKC